MNKIEKGYLGFSEGMYQGMGRDHSNISKYKEVDWNKVEKYIEENKNEIKSVVVGLAEDWGYTSGEVWNRKEGYIKKENTYVHASSSWATPSMEIAFTNGEEEMYESWKTGSNSDSYFVFEN